MTEYTDHESDSFIASELDPGEWDYILCAYCDRILRHADSYSPADEAICARCDTEVTGRDHTKGV